MKLKLSALLCLIASFIKAEPLCEQLSSVQKEESNLYGNLTIENIDRVLEKIRRLGQYQGDMTEMEETELLELSEDGMFLDVLRRYIQSKSQDDFESLKQWEQCKPWLSDLVNEAEKL